MTYTILPATMDHARDLAPRLRALDRAEVEAASGLPPEVALMRSYDLSTHAWAAHAGGRTVALWGVGPLSLSEGKGCPWLLASAAFDAMGPVVARLSRPMLDLILVLYPRLENHVDARHARAVRWLAWLGFAIEPAAPFGHAGLPFHRFHMERAQ